ncbi:MAG: hypothetical protein FWD87_05065 [Spirochaetaceae bacterium]|nr:hypothetical protein [Spirochaetaceae bacterium]
MELSEETKINMHATYISGVMKNKERFFSWQEIAEGVTKTMPEYSPANIDLVNRALGMMIDRKELEYDNALGYSVPGLKEKLKAQSIATTMTSADFDALSDVDKMAYATSGGIVRD